MNKIEFIQPKPRIEDWRVKLNGQSIGSVWRAGAGYFVSVSRNEQAATLDAAFRAARKQVQSLTVADR
ncbi:MAG: hypothetical protein NT159_05665 [Proteobacteria bacterium]|nr:hypothetical protein [Pseudomonadota bacterium]